MPAGGALKGVSLFVAPRIEKEDVATFRAGYGAEILLFPAFF
jgi:hypothetical protein